MLSMIKINSQDIINEIIKQSELISEVTFTDKFKNSRTFHIVYQHPDKNLTNEDITGIRKKITSSLETNFKAYDKIIREWGKASELGLRSEFRLG